MGADLLAIPCNTAHALLDDIASELPAPLVDIVDAALDEAVLLSPEGGWLTATTGTVASGLYQKRAATRGYPLHVPGDTEQERVHAAAGLVKAGRTEEAAGAFQDVVESLWRRRPLPVLAACTELPLAHRASALPPESMISTLQALSRACVAALL